MRLIDADAFREELLRKGFYPVIVAKTLERQPTIEAVPLSEIFRVIAGHSDYHGDNILAAMTCITEGKEVKPIRPIEAVPVHGNKMQDFNNDLIRRTDALNMIHNFFKLKMDSVSGDREEIPMGELDPFLKDNKELSAKIKSIPNIEAVPVVHGEWVIKEDENCFATWDCCSVCGFEMGFAHSSHYAKFCPNCGADMRKEKEVMPAKFNEDGCPFDCPCLDDYPDCYCNEKMDGKVV